MLSNFWWRGTPAGWLGRQPRRPPLGLGPRPHDSTLTRVAVCQPSPLPPRPRPPGRRLVGRRGCALLRPGSLLPAGRTGHGHAVPGGLGPRRLTLAPPPPASSGPGPKVKVEPGERQAGPKGAWARPLAAARGAPLRSELGKGRPRNGSAGGDHRSQEGNSRMSAAHQGSSEVAIQGGPGGKEHPFLNVDHFLCVCLWVFFSLVAFGVAAVGDLRGRVFWRRPRPYRSSLPYQARTGPTPIGHNWCPSSRLCK